ncbi:MAG: TlpA family protein disulfide reductase [Flavobacteriales bacterium]|nr:TlpA family protein disulfide reductase [Flavobacteriales bacterium]
MMSTTFKTYWILVPSVALAACSMGGGGQRSVTITIADAAGRTVYFDRFENNRAVRVDSVVLDGSGKGTMNVAPLPLDFYRISLDESDALVVALDSAESLEVQARTGSLAVPDRLSGSHHTDRLHEFYTASRSFETRLDSLRELLQQGIADSATINAFNDANTDYYDRCIEFIKSNPGSPATLSAVSKLDMQREYDLFRSVRDDLREPMAGSGFYASFRDQVDRMAKQMEAMKKQEEEMKRLSELIPVGGEAPDFTQQTPEGNSLSLSQLRGQVVLIDFWASWCKPCRMENPNVKRVYDKYHSKGFEILGVSLDRTKQAWVNAIEQDGLPWKHVSDLGFWNNAAAQAYGVSSIPFTVLVDKDGKVLDKGLRGQALEKKLAELFGS